MGCGHSVREKSQVPESWGPDAVQGGRRKGKRCPLEAPAPAMCEAGVGFARGRKEGPVASSGLRPPPGRIVAPAPAGGAGPSPTKPPRGRPQDTRPQPGTGPARKGRARQRERAGQGAHAGHRSPHYLLMQIAATGPSEEAGLSTAAACPAAPPIREMRRQGLPREERSW